MNQENFKLQTCCFFGHRKIEITESLKNELYSVVENLIINKNVNIFLFGSKSKFDELCLNVVTSLKRKYSKIQRIYVRAEYPYISSDYTEYLSQIYENTYYPEKLLNAGRAVYVERNYEMIDKSDFCVVYYSGIKNLSGHHSKSGTMIAYEYAKSKNKTVINLAKKV